MHEVHSTEQVERRSCDAATPTDEVRTAAEKHDYLAIPGRSG